MALEGGRERVTVVLGQVFKAENPGQIVCVLCGVDFSPIAETSGAA